MDYESVLKMDELPAHEKTWRNLKHLLLGERIQPEKSTYCVM